MIVEFVGGPMDGQVQEVCDNMGPLIRALTLDCDLAEMYRGDATQPVEVQTREVAYLQDIALDWRYIYQGERQR